MAETIPSAGSDRAAGVLDGARATHWSMAAELDRRYPQISVDVDRILVGSLVVYLKRPAGQSQFSSHLLAQSAASPLVPFAQEWALTTSRPLSVSRHWRRMLA